MSEPSLIVHGGAWDVPAGLEDRCRSGVREAIQRGWAVLASGGTAIDACEAAVIVLEDDPVFDAGIGSHLNRDGDVQMDAILMDGVTLKSGAVACVERLRNPIQIARCILERSDHMLLAGAGAEQFASEQGFALSDPSLFLTADELQRWQERKSSAAELGTVGAAALDTMGNLAAGTSTGGTFYKFPGRVGDSPLVGCGCYADNEGAAISCTGHGESVMKVVMAKTANDLVASGKSPQEAADQCLAILGRRTAGRGGLILVDRFGRTGAAFSTKNLVYAFRTSGMQGPVIRV